VDGCARHGKDDPLETIKKIVPWEDFSALTSRP
jgi:hypothetical protein